MRVINLTLPLYDHMPVGNVWAWDTPFRTEPIINYEEHQGRLFHISMHNECGTRLMFRGTIVPGSPHICDLDWTPFINRDTVVIDLPKDARGEITADDINRIVATDPDYKPGDAVLLRTGWGDNERYRKLGDDYAKNTPHFSDEGAMATVELLHKRGSNMVLTDCAYVGNCGRARMRREWADLPPWQRPPWPSDAAKAYLRHYHGSHEGGARSADWLSSVFLLENLYTIGALCNCGSITKKRVKITLLPMNFAVDGGAPCTVVAVEQ